MVRENFFIFGYENVEFHHICKFKLREAMRRYAILLVDDDPFILKGIGMDLEREGYQVKTAKNGEEAIELMNKNIYDLVITDLVMDAVDGIGVLKTAKAIYPEIMVIVLTGYGDMTSAIDALRLNADDYILKPCDLDELYFRVGRCLEKYELQQKVKIYENILPVCCVCKKIRDDTGTEPGSGEWQSVEKYIWEKAKLEVTSTYCPVCAKKAMDEIEN
jgi:YesN/AraC family two-component response regulator